MSSPDTLNATSSPESVAGHSRSDWQESLSRPDSGLAAALANLSARQAKELGLLTSGTCGPHSSGSSTSADLQSSLASKLQAATASTGSTLYALTWKVRPTPLGRPICALRASVRRTSVSGSTGWPTPLASDHRPGHESRAYSTARSNLNDRAVLAGWPTATAALADKGVRTFEGGLLEAMRNHGPDLAAAACLTGWPTPMAGTPAQKGYNAAGNNDSSRKTVDVCKVDQPIRYTASGQVLTGSDAGMESSGQLNPDHSRWLMGYPPAWQRCVVTAMRLCRPLRRPSLKR